MRTMTCLIGAEHDIAVHLCNFIKDSRGSSRVLPYHAQKKRPATTAALTRAPCAKTTEA